MKKPPPLKAIKTVSAIALGALIVFLIMFYYSTEVKSPAGETSTEVAPAQTDTFPGDPNRKADGSPRGKDEGPADQGRPGGNGRESKGGRR